MRKLLPRVYWAAPGRFLAPGVVVFAFGRHWRVLPVGPDRSERAPRLSRRELCERVIELERRLAAVQDQSALRMASVERRANLHSAFHRDRIETLERQIRELNPGLPPVDRTFAA
jgi:hypothetical protein